MQNLPKYLVQQMITYPDDVMLNVTQTNAIYIYNSERPLRPPKADRLDDVKAFHCHILNWRDHLEQSEIKT